ncbi:GAF and ANTAR domain-containing protein [Actinoplanes sp. NPDC051633]|uniref:GAF and ANTAR domain-containing protein n=1 Tax=Actinoplanes sp. NPDC051633 TaxID=3155670 RepID=UPI003412C585
MTSLEPLDPTAAFAELGRIKLSETNLDDVLSRVADLAKRTLPGTPEVSVTLIRGARAHTVAFTGPVASTLDEWQYERGYGPCLDAASAATTLSVPDMAVETRWPDWSARAAQAGVRSSLAIALPVQEDVVGALNVYSLDPKAFDDDAVALAEKFGGYAAVAVANAHFYDATATLARQMRTAMESRAVIEQAKGIIMGQRRCTADEAFTLISKLSQDCNRKLREVAEALVAEARGT